MRKRRSFGILFAGICFFIWIGSETRALAQVVPTRIVETIDIQVLQADNIVVGQITGVTEAGKKIVVTLRPETTLKGNPKKSLKREVNATDGTRLEAVRGMLVRKSRVLVIGPVFISLDIGNLAIHTARGDILRGPDETLSYATEVLRTYPPGAPVSVFLQPMPGGGAKVPVGPYLKTWALDTVRSGHDLDTALLALRRFKSQETIADLRSLLGSPVFSVEQEPETNMGIEVRIFPVRRAVYGLLKDWGVTVEAPQFRQEVSRLADVTRIVWRLDRVPDDADFVRLLDARRLRTLEFPRPGLITDARMATIARFTNLTGLKIRGRITDAGLKPIRTLINLEDLDLSLTRITDQALAELAGLPNLKRLTLAGTQLSDDGLEILSRFHKLEYLNVAKSKTTANGADAVKRARPGIQIARKLEVWEWGFKVATDTETLALSAFLGAIEQARWELDKKHVSPNGKDLSGTPVLVYAVLNGNEGVLKALLDKGARVNVIDPSGATPLAWAARHGHTRAMRLLLDRRADVRVADNEGNTALHFAARQENPEAARMLIAAGANPSARNKAGDTASDISRKLGRKATEETLRH